MRRIFQTRYFTLSVVVGLLLGLTAIPTWAALRVALDCNICDEEHLRRELDYVEWVRDQADADVHLLLATERAATGQRWSISFRGLGPYSGLDDELSFLERREDSDAQSLDGLRRVVSLGLARYLARAEDTAEFEVRQSPTFDGTLVASPEAPGWVYRIGGNAGGASSEVTSTLNLSSSLGADRVSDFWKLRFSALGQYSESRFQFSDEEEFLSIIRSANMRALVIKRLNDHWATGAFSSWRTSTFDNLDGAAVLDAALEYSPIPYSQTSWKSLRIGYFLGLRQHRYVEETIFRKNREALLHHNLEAEMELIQAWGTASFTLRGAQWLTDFHSTRSDLWRLEAAGYASIRLGRGLSLSISARASKIRDQIALPLSNATEEEILLGSINLPTDYSLSGSLGLSYTFGSIFSGAVNPAFGL